MRRVLTAFLLLVSTTFGAEEQTPVVPVPVPVPVPQQILGSDKPVGLGELVDLSVRRQSSVAKNAVGFTTEWSVFDLEARKELKFKFYRELASDKSVDVEGIVFGAGTTSREVWVNCAVTYVIGEKEGDKLTKIGAKTELLRAKVTIGEPPKPAPNPPTPPGPSLIFPNEKLGLSTKVYNAVIARGPPADVRKLGAKCLSMSFRGTQSAIVAGALKDPADILKKSTASNLSAITTAGLKREDWLPVFLVIQDELYALYESSKVTSADQFGAAFLEIADAFDAVK